MRRGTLSFWFLGVALALAAAGAAPPGGQTVSAGATARLTGSDTAAGPTTTLALPPAFPTTTTKPPHRSLVATVIGPTIDVFAEPDDTVPPTWTLGNPRPSGAEQVFLVVEERAGWLKVMVPVRPNGSVGWIRSDEVTIVGHDYSIVVELGAHKLTVYNGDSVFQEETVGVGVNNTPTPGGFFYTVELISSQQPEYGPFAYGLSGYSEVIYDFAGGDGQFGIHGTDDPSGLGNDVSSGCIRMSNEGITRLAETLPIGVPVEIRA